MRLERTRSDGSREFWEAKRVGKRVKLARGVIGEEIMTITSTKEHATSAIAHTALARLIATKRKAGFTEPNALGASVMPAEMPRNPALEERIRETCDEGAIGVYADWLQSQGSPAGELIVLVQALARKRDAKKQKRLDALITKLGLPDPDFATWSWQPGGLWGSLHLQNSRDWMDESFDAVGLAKKLFATPLCAALDELRIGILRWDHNDKDVPGVIAEAAKQPWAKSLERLHLGDVPDDIDMNHHVIGDVGKLVSKAFPALESLKLHSGSQSWRDGGETFGISKLDLPELETLVIETCAMTKQRLKHVFAAKLPALTRLELWFGSTEHSDATARDLAKLLDGSVLPGVRHLGLCNHEFAAELVDRITSAPIATRLETLDLSMSTLSDDDATRLAAAAARFPKLRTLDVDDCYLTPAGVRALRTAFKRAAVISDDQRDFDPADPDDRYASVTE
ncbi:MAG: hypothetical protein H0T89_33365 [Deltaproteobacteria bacterium]|nr:hypothetical protein [Deltaproteobacteria bacterium]MDQ3297988.1 hypothetical protein [Myxococcota bacterium]